MAEILSESVICSPSEFIQYMFPAALAIPFSSSIPAEKEPSADAPSATN
jgi:hypothetical protein